MEKLEERYPFRYVAPIKWGEIDALGHLNNTVYFRFAEEARIKLFQSFGNKVNLEDGVGPVLAFIDFQFVAPVHYPDTVFVGSWIEKVGTTSMHLVQDFYSESQQKLVGKSKSVLVNIDYGSGSKLEISDPVRAAVLNSQRNYKGIATQSSS